MNLQCERKAIKDRNEVLKLKSRVKNGKRLQEKRERAQWCVKAAIDLKSQNHRIVALEGTSRVI